MRFSNFRGGVEVLRVGLGQWRLVLGRSGPSGIVIPAPGVIGFEQEPERIPADAAGVPIKSLLGWAYGVS